MAIYYKCPCGKYYQFANEHAGRTGTYSACGAPITIPPAPECAPLTMPVAAPSSTPVPQVAPQDIAPKAASGGPATVGGTVATPQTPTVAPTLSPADAPDPYLLAYAEIDEQKLYRLYRGKKEILFLHVGQFYEDIALEQFGRAGYRAGLIGVGGMALAAGTWAYFALRDWYRD